MDVLISPVALAAPQWIIDLLMGGGIFAMAQQLWNFVMNIVLSLLGMNLIDFQASGAGAWEYINNTVFPFFLGMGSVFLNMFVMAGFCRQASNLKEGITTEALIEIFIKLVAANMLMLNSLEIMQEINSFAVKATGFLINSYNVPSIVGDDYDLGFSIAMSALGLIYLIMAGVCSITILIEVAGRFVNLFMLIGVAPVALSALAGGKGLEQTAAAWCKSFLTSALQIIIIALTIQIVTKINWSITAFFDAGGLTSWFNGAVSVIGSVVFMPLLASCIKQSDSFLRRAFGLG